MTTKTWSEAALQRQFDALADMFHPGSAWVAWKFDVRTTRTEGYLWWQTTITRTETIEEKRCKVAYTRNKRSLVFHLPPHMRHMERPYTGWILGMNIYVNADDAEPIVFIPFNGNTNILMPGSAIDLEDDVYIDMETR